MDWLRRARGEWLPWFVVNPHTHDDAIPGTGAFALLRSSPLAWSRGHRRPTEETWYYQSISTRISDARDC